MPPKKLIVRKETWKTQKKCLKIVYVYKNKNHDLWEWLVKTVPENLRFKIFSEPLMLKTTWIFSGILKTGAILKPATKIENWLFLQNKSELPNAGWNNRPTLV